MTVFIINCSVLRPNPSGLCTYILSQNVCKPLAVASNEQSEKTPQLYYFNIFFPFQYLLLRRLFLHKCVQLVRCKAAKSGFENCFLLKAIIYLLLSTEIMIHFLCLSQSTLFCLLRIFANLSFQSSV